MTYPQTPSTIYIGMRGKRGELIKGSVEHIILFLLSKKPMHGYLILKELERRSGGYFKLSEGTIYPTLHRLEMEGLIEGRWERGPQGLERKVYSLTPKGLKVLEGREREWRGFIRALNMVFGEG